MKKKVSRVREILLLSMPSHRCGPITFDSRSLPSNPLALICRLRFILGSKDAFTLLTDIFGLGLAMVSLSCSVVRNVFDIEMPLSS